MKILFLVVSVAVLASVLQKTEAAVKCDATHECPSGNTCCTTASGQWACCPAPQAVCCSDHVHCCPHATTCDLSTGKCNPANGYAPMSMLKKQPAIVSMTPMMEVVKEEAVKCDATHECPSGNTCCTTASGQWACCPAPQAVCCSDHVHCCPHATTCDLSTGKCNPGNGYAPMSMLRKQPAIVSESKMMEVVKEEAVKCDATHECPSGNTCCTTASGQWACCPAPQAVCCSDHVHCCPHATTCDLSTGKCNPANGYEALSMLRKQPAIVRKTAVITVVKGVRCDATTECPTGQTCCPGQTTGYWCCPTPQAMCCFDHVHCCPMGSTCLSGQCLPGAGYVALPWVRRQPAFVSETKVVEVGKEEAVKCDATHECPSGNTCCTTASGQWACCPAPQAVCCSDHVHCCPHATTCDLSTGKCNPANGYAALSMLRKQPAIVRKTAVITVVKGVRCDATTECPTGQTCCPGPTQGAYWCCPAPQAMCCFDQVHCCPIGFTCVGDQCLPGAGYVALPWVRRQPAFVSETKMVEVVKEEAVKCDATHECPSGNTCCTTASGQWACCPAPQAVCCSDHVHCCPHATTCDLSTGKCNPANGYAALSMLRKQPVIVRETKMMEVVKVEAVKCDATHECPSGNTCCTTASGQWACCPAPQAVCCSDHVHCCPHATTCDLSTGKCNPGNGYAPMSMLKKQPAIVSMTQMMEVVKEEAVKCDATHECPSGNTCCTTASGQWACCPAPQAVCCSDHVHCCPHATTCDLSTGKCNPGQGYAPMSMLKKQPAIVSRTQVMEVVKEEAVKCDATHECPSGNTCCTTASGQWACCPAPQAVCCSDHVHCCPHATTCDLSSGKCNPGQGYAALSMLKKQPAIVSRTQMMEVVKEEAVKCDATHECPSGNTCCTTASGQWACCPAPQAVCCSDHVHCCPHATTCDLSTGKCNPGNGYAPMSMLRKQPAIVSMTQMMEVVKEEAVKCDATHECPSGNTCCTTASGQWACCPAPQAVCCSDHVHCCPHATTCDLSTGKCNPANGYAALSMLKKQPAIVSRTQMLEVVKEGAVKCDATHECPSGNTCCTTASGQWACCPAPQAVCCSDHVHCCPHATTCDLSTGKCNPANGYAALSMLKKQPAIVSRTQMMEVVKEEAVKCDATHECPSGNTCCTTASGQWACCPAPQAVCCSDHVHCCPHATTCDLSTGKCNPGRGNTALSWLTKQPVIVRETPMMEVVKVEAVKCDATHECPSGNTCCTTASGQWACCPAPQAVCCSDHVHCCPHATTCDLSTGKCNPAYGYAALPLLKKQPVIVRETQMTEALKEEGTKCENTTHVCPAGNTCCLMGGGKWGCCTYADGVCCAGGTTCCDHGTTCCPMPGGAMGCCPVVKGVCCPDHEHCCPTGWKCNAASERCHMGLRSFAWLEKLPASINSPASLIVPVKKEVMEVMEVVKVEAVKCDATHECPSGNTCCTTASGQWACCPAPQAVCCSDHVHCCPHATTCDLSTGKCNPAYGYAALSMLKKQPAIVSEPLVAEVKAEIWVHCNATTACPVDNTCCRKANGDWGCCQLYQAVCCSDHVHCCPGGTTCDLTNGKCNSADGRSEALPWVRKQSAIVRK